MNEVKLKPCPFCGSRAKLAIHEYLNGTYPNTYGVYCSDCKALTYQFYDTEKEAIKAWDTRHEPPTPGGAIVPAGNERLVKKVK